MDALRMCNILQFTHTFHTKDGGNNWSGKKFSLV